MLHNQEYEQVYKQSLKTEGIINNGENSNITNITKERNYNTSHCQQNSVNPQKNTMALVLRPKEHDHIAYLGCLCGGL